jgi:hypothetical protein
LLETLAQIAASYGFEIASDRLETFRARSGRRSARKARGGGSNPLVGSTVVLMLVLQRHGAS